MLRSRSSSDSRLVTRPLVWLTAAALASSATPAFAESAAGTVTTTASASTAGTGAATSTPVPTATPPEPPPAPKDEGTGLKTAGYILGGLGIAGFVLFAVAGISAKNAHDRLDEDCAAGRCNDASHASDIEDGKLFQTAANVGLAAGLTGVGLGATLIVLGTHSSSDTPPAPGNSPTGAILSFSGRF
jgi:hypothetical protein